MPSQAQVQQMILSAEWKRANLIYNRATALMAGLKPLYEKEIRRYRYLIAAVTRQYQIGDYVSPLFLIVYECLSTLVGIDTSVGTIDPNYKGPNTIINVTSGGGALQPVELTFTEANLVDDGAGGFYLRVAGATGLIIVSTTINGIGQSGLTPDYTQNPPTLAGFANNDPTQEIVITCI